MNGCWLNEDCVAPNKHDGDCLFPASDGRLCMIDKPAIASFRPARQAHKVSCAGCDCEPGTTCDTRKNCTYCGNHKTYCDSLSPVSCCERCRHV